MVKEKRSIEVLCFLLYLIVAWTPHTVFTAIWSNHDQF